MQPNNQNNHIHTVTNNRHGSTSSETGAPRSLPVSRSADDGEEVQGDGKGTEEVEEDEEGSREGDGEREGDCDIDRRCMVLRGRNQVGE